MGGKVQGIRGIIDGYKIDRGRLIVWEMEKPKNMYVTHGHELWWWLEGTGWRGIKGRKVWDSVIA